MIYFFLALMMAIHPLWAVGIADYDLTIAPGLTYRNDSRLFYVLTVDPRKVRLELHANDIYADAQTVSSISAHFQPLAAVNAGFFAHTHSETLKKVMFHLFEFFGYYHYAVRPVFSFKIYDQWLSFSADRATGTLGWRADGSYFLMDALKTIPDQTQSVLFVNTENVDVSAWWEPMDYVLAGTPLLVRNGAVVDYVKTFRNAFYRQPTARTAIGIKKDGNILIVVAKKITLPALAEKMLGWGCIDALNLDGGDSSAMVIKGKVVNKPAKDERPVSNVIALFPVHQHR